MSTVDIDNYIKLRNLLGDIEELTDVEQKESLLLCFVQYADYTKSGAVAASLVLSEAIYSSNQIRALNACHLLMLCFEQCHHHFRCEVLTFRFLNKLIKLIAPEYRASHTPPAVRQCVADILYSWRNKMADNSKICEAFSLVQRKDLLGSLGITARAICSDDIAEIVASQRTAEKHPDPRKNTKTEAEGRSVMEDSGRRDGGGSVMEGSERRSGGGSVMEDEEYGARLRRLLQSKHQYDLTAANNLIRTMVKKEEARTERMGQLTNELHTAQYTAQLLDDMLTGYSSASTTGDECDMMSELKSQLLLSCQRFQQLAAVSEDTNIGELVSLAESVNSVIDRYNRVFGNSHTALTASGNTAPLSLLDLSPQTQNEQQNGGFDFSQKKASGADDYITISTHHQSSGPSLSLLSPSPNKDVLNNTSTHSPRSDLCASYSHPLSGESVLVPGSSCSGSYHEVPPATQSLSHSSFAAMCESHVDGPLASLLPVSIYGPTMSRQDRMLSTATSPAVSSVESQTSSTSVTTSDPLLELQHMFQKELICTHVSSSSSLSSANANAKTHTLSQSVTESPIIPTEPARQPISQKETAYSSLIGSQINTNSPPSNQILDSLTLSLDDVIPSEDSAMKVLEATEHSPLGVSLYRTLCRPTAGVSVFVVVVENISHRVTAGFIRVNVVKGQQKTGSSQDSSESMTSLASVKLVSASQCDCLAARSNFSPPNNCSYILMVHTHCQMELLLNFSLSYRVLSGGVCRDQPTLQADIVLHL